MTEYNTVFLLHSNIEDREKDRGTWNKQENKNIIYKKEEEITPVVQLASIKDRPSSFFECIYLCCILSIG